MKQHKKIKIAGENNNPGEVIKWLNDSWAVTFTKIDFLEVFLDVVIGSDINGVLEFDEETLTLYTDEKEKN